MNRRQAWIGGGILLAGLTAAAIYFGFLQKGPEPVPPKGAVAEDGPAVRPQPPVFEPAPVSLAAATEHHYRGEGAKQVGVKENTIVPQRAAVLKGRVLTRDGQPLEGVKVYVAHHPEFGHTQSQGDGAFNLVVNGGGMLCVNYDKNGFLPLCRHTAVPWQDYAWLPDVVLIPLDPEVMTIRLDDPAPMQVARGKVVKDQDGERQATLLFAKGTTAQMFLPDKTKKALSTISVRITEYTVGASGQAAMPAALPPTSAYTYACELTADEVAANGGIKVGGKDLLFNQPAIFLVDNFLKFPVGTPVPMGYFDNDRAAWVAADSGLVVGVLAPSGELADLDLDGKGKAADAAALKKLGVSDAERRQLAALYKPGQSLWRVPTNHFSTVDPNQAPSDGKAADGEGANGERTDCPPPTASQTGASVIDIHNQILREDVAVAGTPLRLYYHSGRVPGHGSGRSLEIPLSGADIPKSLKRIDLEVQIAGQKHAKSFPGKPSQSYTFVWDGKDGDGRPVAGSQKATIRIGYVYDGLYQAPARFGEPPVRPTPTRSRGEFIFWREEMMPVGGLDARVLGLAGWSLSIQHAYDPVSRVLYLGDGRRMGGAKGTVQAINQGIVTVAGGGSNFALGDDGPAVQARLDNLKAPTGAGFQRNRMPRYPRGLAVAADGSLFIADGNSRIRKVSPDGTIRTVAGGGQKEAADGMTATEADLKVPRAIALGPDGSLYFVETRGHRVRCLRPDGTLMTVAGTGSQGFAGDGGPAVKARLAEPSGLAVAPDGTIYVADLTNHRVRRIGPDGFISTVAGTGKQGYAGDGGPGAQAQLFWPNSLALAADGSLYIADTGNYVIRRLSPAGILTTVAGTFRTGWEREFAGDGGPALKAKFNEPTAMALGPDGALYVADTENHRIRRVGVDGVITTIAGSAPAGKDDSVNDTAGDGGPAVQARLSYPAGLAFGPDGSLYCYDGWAISDRGTDPMLHRIRRIAPSLPGFSNQEIVVPSEDGRQLFKFDAGGKHLETRDALTQSILHRFGYDKNGRLSKIEDSYANALTIERDAAGHPTALVAPFGQRTTLEMNPQGYLARIVAPADEEYHLTYGPGGLLASFQPPGRNASRFTFDELGRLTKDEHPAGGFIELKRTGDGQNHEIAVNTSLTPATTYRVEKLPGGGERRLETCCCGAETKYVKTSDQGYDAHHPNGVVDNVRFQADPRWGMQTPLLKSWTLTTPGGKKTEAVLERKAVLAEPRNPLSLTSLIDTVTVNGRKFSRTFDVARKQVVLRSVEGREVIVTRDEHGRVMKTEAAGLAPLIYRHDKHGRLEAIQQGEGKDAREVTYSYDAAGRLASRSDPHLGESRYAYDKAGRLARQTLPDGGEIQFSFDALGNLRSLTPPGKSAHTFDFTPGNLPQSYRAPSVDGTTAATTYEFDRDRKLTKVNRPNGKAIALEYTTAGLLDSITTPGRKLKFTRDAKREQLTRIEFPDGTLSFNYDGFLPTGAVWDGVIKGTVTRAYDNDFRVVARKVNDGPVVAFAYDGDGLLVNAGALSVDRDAKTGFVKGTRLGNVATAHEYNAFGERKRFVARFGDKDVMNIDYERDPVGRIVKNTETINGKTDVYVYEYNRAGRLSTVTKNGNKVGHYTYDPNGNRLRYEGQLGSFSGSYDAQDRILQYGDTTFTHTTNGDLLTKTQGGKTIRYDYDALGNLRSMELPDGAKIDYLVDGGNRRVGRKINGKLVQGLLWDGALRPVAELDGDGKVVSRFVYATGVNVPEYMERDSKAYRLVTDHLGSVRLVLDAASGEVAQRIDYDEFGNVLQDTRPGFQPFGFAGGLYDLQTRLVRFGVRDYDSAAGLWTARDPIGFQAGDSNLYSYVRNDPINLSDVSGLTYVDFNAGGYAPFGAGGNAGIMVSDTGWYPYVGVGMGTPGPSGGVFISPDQASGGSFVGAGVAYGWGGQIGLDSSGTEFGEIGFGAPGASATANYAWRFRWPWDWWRDRQRNRERDRERWEREREQRDRQRCISDASDGGDVTVDCDCP